MNPVAEPLDGLGRYQSVKRVLAGEIAAVVTAGCYVRDRDGTEVLRIYPEGMTARYTPVVGDFWVIYPKLGGEPKEYQSISPRQAFLDGYMPMEAPPG